MTDSQKSNRISKNLASRPVLFEKLKFLRQYHGQWSEKIFLFFALVFSFGAAIRLIYRVWYDQEPITVTHQNKEQDIDSIPFPAVTVCNLNQFPRKLVKNLKTIADIPEHKQNSIAKSTFAFMRTVCRSRQSFRKYFGFREETQEEKDLDNDSTNSEDRSDEMIDFLMDNAQSCDEMIKLCILGHQPVNCSEIFKPVITDYGKCCIFNILPLPLLRSNSTFKNLELQKNSKDIWTQKEVHNWDKWDYKKGYRISGKDLDNKYPWKQKIAGLANGLSILIDGNQKNYVCPGVDATGIRYILHSPLEIPLVSDLSSVAGLGRQVLVEVHPDMTVADNDIEDIDVPKRNCYFGSEKKLKLFDAYTGVNCVEECVGNLFFENCNCSLYYMPDGIDICDNDPTSAEYKCADKTKAEMKTVLRKKCSQCLPLCENLDYNYVSTINRLKMNKTLFFGRKPEAKIPEWADHELSVIHFFFGRQSFTPKLRKRRSTLIDLIGNTGGVLGLCIGFSVLSAFELIYFAIFGSCSKYFETVSKALRRFYQATCSCISARLNPRNVNSSRIVLKNPTFITVRPMTFVHHGFVP